MPLMTRRRMLTVMATAAGADLLPASVQRALAAGTPRRGSLQDVEHVVMLMQENRSFDHYFGTLAGVRGFDDPHALLLETGRSVFHQPDNSHPDGYLLPYRLNTRTTSAQAIPSTDHSWHVQHRAWNGGKLDAWMSAHRAADGTHAPYVMGYYTREDIPFHFALADSFTICDHYFSSVQGPTWPNRLHWMTGGIDAEGRHGGPVTGFFPDRELTWTTYAEQLEAAQVSWRVYQESESRDFNTLAAFAAFKHAKPGDPLHDKAMTAQPAGTFEDDARADRLPAVSWILPTTDRCEHPNALPAAGADFIASKIEAIAANPKVWAKTVFILNYDENDGLFDHVPPPVPPSAPPASSSRACRSEQAFEYRASSSPPGPRVAAWPPNSSTTPRSCSSWNASPAYGPLTSPTGAARPLATSPPPSSSTRAPVQRPLCLTPLHHWSRPSTTSPPCPLPPRPAQASNSHARSRGAETIHPCSAVARAGEHHRAAPSISVTPPWRERRGFSLCRVGVAAGQLGPSNIGGCQLFRCAPGEVPPLTWTARYWDGWSRLRLHGAWWLPVPVGRAWLGGEGPGPGPGADLRGGVVAGKPSGTAAL